VVRGWVWEMYAKNCENNRASGTYRFGLFIHSEGYTGWQNSNYKSEGWPRSLKLPGPAH